jgi:hypothetical protein
MTNVHFGYGRTRRPKNIAGPDGTPAVSQTLYRTENQRFLTVHNASAQTVTAVQVRIAAAVTGLANEPSKLATLFERDSQGTLVLDNEGNPVPVTVAAGEIRQFEILGADEVSVTHGAVGVGNLVYLACSTF